MICFEAWYCHALFVIASSLHVWYERGRGKLSGCENVFLVFMLTLSDAKREEDHICSPLSPLPSPLNT